MIVKSTELKPGHIVTWSGTYALVVSVGPCETLPSRARGYIGSSAAEDYVEPGLVILTHFSDDRWVQTHMFTYALFRRRSNVVVHTQVRTQVWPRHGQWLSGTELVEAMLKMSK